MDTKEYFRKLFHYDEWANREFLTALQSTSVPPKALRFLAHTLSAQKLWWERLQRVPQSVAVWPTLTLEQCAALQNEMASAWREYLSGLSLADFEKEIDYRNSKGEAFSSRVEDVITHVLMHSAYHRGQAALEMRAAGIQPAYTDFIHGVRQGFVK